jgi:CheY-like chemotaxis protein
LFLVNRQQRGKDDGQAGLVPQALGSEPVSKSMQALKTYIVEDSPVIREGLIATLEELAPVQVVGASGDEASALSWLGEAGRTTDLVIVDIFLSSGSGLGVLRAVHGTAGLGRMSC